VVSVEKPGRPKKWKEGFRLTSLAIPKEYEELWRMASKMAEAEGLSVSEILFKALSEYIKMHAPGNPQTILVEAKPDPVREAFRSMRLRALRELLEKPWPDRSEWMKQLEHAVQAALRYGVSYEDPEVKAALGILKGEPNG
jgi:hypothetical protein